MSNNKIDYVAIDHSNLDRKTVIALHRNNKSRREYTPTYASLKRIERLAEDLVNRKKAVLGLILTTHWLSTIITIKH